MAEHQHGVITMRQLLALGLGPSAVQSRAASGRLHRVHRGVYAVGHRRLTWDGHLWAATLATGGAASHRSAAAVWDLRAVPSGDVEVLTFCGARSVEGVRVHRSSSLAAHDVISRDGLLVTTPARTLVDLAAVLDPYHLERVVDQAEVLRLFDLRAIDEVLGRVGRVRGLPALRAALAALAEHGPAVTETPIEDAFLELVFRFGLPRPRTQVSIGVHRVDFLWPEQRLVVETDGGAHDRPRGFRRDRAKSNALQLAGYRVLRLTWDDVTRGAAETAAMLREALYQR